MVKEREKEKAGWSRRRERERERESNYNYLDTTIKKYFNMISQCSGFYVSPLIFYM